MGSVALNLPPRLHPNGRERSSSRALATHSRGSRTDLRAIASHTDATVHRGAAERLLVVRSERELGLLATRACSEEQRRFRERRVIGRCSDSSKGAVSGGSRRPPQTAGFVGAAVSTFAPDRRPFRSPAALLARRAQPGKSRSLRREPRAPPSGTTAVAQIETSFDECGSRRRCCRLFIRGQRPAWARRACLSGGVVALEPVHSAAHGLSDAASARTGRRRAWNFDASETKGRSNW